MKTFSTGIAGIWCAKARSRSMAIGAVVALLAVTGGSVAAQSGTSSAPTVAALITGDFAVARYPALQTTPPSTPGVAPATAKYLVEVTPSGGFTGALALSVAGLPTSVTAVFAPSTLTTGGTSTLTLTTSSATPEGTYPFTINVTNGTGAAATVRSATATLNVSFALVPKCSVAVSGVVTDSVSGSPVAGATVTLNGRNVTTDALGKYTQANIELADNNAPQTFSLSASKDSPRLNRIGTYWPSVKSALAACERVNTLNFTLVAVLPAQMSGKVVVGQIVGNDYANPVPVAAMTPVPGAKVNIGAVASQTTTSTGDYRFVDDTGRVGFQLAANNATLPGTVAIVSPTADSAGVPFPARQAYWPSNGFGVGVINPGAVLTPPPVALIRQCTASLAGVVRDSAGLPVPDARVSVRSTDTRVNDTINITTGADGTYSIPNVLFGYNNQPSTLRIQTSKPGLTPVSVDTATATCGLALSSDITMSSDNGISFGGLSGRVVDSVTDEPIANVNITLQGCTPVVAATDCLATKTAADGTYGVARIPLRGGATTLSVSITATQPTTPPPSHWSASVSTTIETGRVTPIAPIKLLRRKFGSLQGRVIDSVSRQPIAGAAMTLTGGSRVPCVAPCVTSAAGTYGYTGVELNPGNTTRIADLKASFTGYWDKAVKPNIVADTPTVQDFELVKKCVGGTVTGVVLNAVTREPLPGATVVATSPQTTGQVFSTTSDAQGKYRLTGLPTDKDNAPIVTTMTASKTGFYSETQKPTVFCGSSLVVDFGRQPGQVGTISGRLTRASDGSPIAQAFVGAEFGGSATTDAAGNYTIPNAPVNIDGTDRTWLVTARPNGFDEQRLPVTVRLNQNSVLNFSFALASLDVVVTNDANRDSTFGSSEQVPSGATYPRVVTYRVAITNSSGADRSVTAIDDDLVGALAISANTTAPSGSTGCDARVGVVLLPAAATSCFFDVTLTAPGASPRQNTVLVTGNNGVTGSGTSTVAFGTGPTSTTTTVPPTTSTTTTSTTSTTVPPTTTTTSTTSTTTSTTTSAPTTTSTTTTSTTTTTIPAPTPRVTGLSPTSGSTAGGNSVVITGTGFTGATVVRFGVSAASGFTVNSATQITATAPAGAAGIVDVTVQTPVATSVVSAGSKYTYVAPNRAPVVYGVSPGSGPGGGGNQVILAGVDLTGTSSVTFGGRPAPSFTVVNAGEIRVTAPAGVTGLVPVQVITPNGASPVTEWTYYRYGAQQVCFLFWCWWL